MKFAVVLPIALSLAACALGARITYYNDSACSISMGPTVFGFPNPNNITAQCTKTSNAETGFTPAVTDTWSKEVSCTASSFVAQIYQFPDCSVTAEKPVQTLPGATGVCINNILVLRGNVKSLKVECPGALPTVKTSAACCARSAGAVVAVIAAAFLLA